MSRFPVLVDTDAPLSDRPERASRESFSERYERLRSFRKAHARLQGDLERLSTHPAWAFGTARGADRRKLLKRASRELDEEMARAQNAFAELDDFLLAIGKSRAPKERGRRRR